jgi:hypothetical protein
MDAGESGAGWHPFDPGDLKAGVYWLTLVQGGKRIIRKKVVASTRRADECPGGSPRTFRVDRHAWGGD